MNDIEGLREALHCCISFRCGYCRQPSKCNAGDNFIQRADVAFEELQEYRQLGTVEELNQIAEHLASCEQQLAHYIDLAEQGKLIELPVPLGTTVYMRYMDCSPDYKMSYCNDHDGGCESCPHRTPVALETEFWYDLIPLWGKTVFKTKELVRLPELEE